MKVVDTEITGVFYTNIIYSKDEEDRSPFVEPNARGGGVMVIPCFIEARF